MGRVALALLAVTTATLPAPVGSQEVATTRPEPSATILELRKDPAVAHGRVAVLAGTADRSIQRFRLQSLSVLQPVLAVVLAHDGESDIRLSLVKPGENTARLSGSTRGTGWVSFATRTQGGLDLLVEGSGQPSPFALVVWASDELTPRLADVIVGRDRPGAAVAGSSSSVFLGLAILGIGLLTVITRRLRRRNHA